MAMADLCRQLRHYEPCSQNRHSCDNRTCRRLNTPLSRKPVRPAAQFVIPLFRNSVRRCYGKVLLAGWNDGKAKALSSNLGGSLECLISGGGTTRIRSCLHDCASKELLNFRDYEPFFRTAFLPKASDYGITGLRSGVLEELAFLVMVNGITDYRQLPVKPALPAITSLVLRAGIRFCSTQVAG